jgi:shikimate kinase/3-dehydroquinate synthase
VREALRRHTVVLLDVDVDTAWRRCAHKRVRPLARDHGRFAALHAERAPLYAALADAVLPDSGRDVVRRAARALQRLGRAPAGTKLLWAITASGDYPVLVGEGVLGAEEWPVAGRRFLVTDEHVGELYAARLGDVAADVRIPPGEQAKTLATTERVLRALAGAGMDHDDHVTALGGGVVGDLAGFAAAVYQRGVGVVQLPTTLVAQVDSAYGGKTGVDLPEGKNYAGAYHQPAAVLADTSTLATLPPAELAAGWAEVVKTALIAGSACARARRGRIATPSSRVRAPSSTWSPPTSATAAAGRCSTSATRSATRSRR